jgi:hypothetical protein
MSGASAPRDGSSNGALPSATSAPGPIVRTSPVPLVSASPAPTGGPRGDSALALTAPSMIIVPAPNPSPSPRPTAPEVSPREAPPLPRLEDVQANAPARRLITSLAALREPGREASVGQLRAFATDTSLMLGVPFKTQIDGSTYSLVNCGPASLAMVLGAYGIDVDPASVRDYLNYLVGNYDTEIGTSLDTLGRIAREAGLSTLGLYGRGGYRPWTVGDVREYVRAGYPVITLTKYRKLPGHLGSQTDFDHYVVITGLAGDDFVYHDAAFATDYGRNLLISPAELEQAWAASSIPRHAMAVGLGEAIRPLPIVPRRLQPEALAARPGDTAADTEAVESIQAIDPAERPLNMVPGRATQNLRERLLEELGARSSSVGAEESPRGPHPSDVPPSNTAILANIRVPAEARPDGEAPARLVVPGTIEVGALTDTSVAAEIGGASGPPGEVPDAEAVAASGAAEAEEHRSPVGAQLTGLTGLGLLIIAWIGRRRGRAAQRQIGAGRRARASTDRGL